MASGVPLRERRSSRGPMATRIETSIGKRRHKRIKMVLPVKVSGRDAANNLISELAHTLDITPDGARLGAVRHPLKAGDRKSTRLNSSHVAISYAVFCLKKKK